MRSPVSCELGTCSISSESSPSTIWGAAAIPPGLHEPVWAELDRHALREHEWVMALKHLALTHEFSPPPPPPGLQHSYRAHKPPPPPELVPVLAVGTAYVLGEDNSCTGRILLLRVASGEAAAGELHMPASAAARRASKEEARRLRLRDLALCFE